MNCTQKLSLHFMFHMSFHPKQHSSKEMLDKALDFIWLFPKSNIFHRTRIFYLGNYLESGLSSEDNFKREVIEIWGAMIVVFKQIDFIPESQGHKTYFGGVDSFYLALYCITGTFHRIPK